ncbi:MAG: hypothetical protein JWO26_2442 [Rhodospirillales bacterium]|jgi:hypothetical protein|nr:hypothetical protein [Rhodospirillales bacterium]
MPWTEDEPAARAVLVIGAIVVSLLLIAAAAFIS